MTARHVRHLWLPSGRTGPTWPPESILNKTQGLRPVNLFPAQRKLIAQQSPLERWLRAAASGAGCVHSQSSSFHICAMGPGHRSAWHIHVSKGMQRTL